MTPAQRLAASLAVACLLGVPAQAARKPDVVMVILDAARADHVSSYGYPRRSTPRLDALARKGTTFLNDFTQAPWTQDSVPRILSSRYYSRQLLQKDSWVWATRLEWPDTLRDRLDAEQVFLPQLLAANGYKTVLVSDHPWIVPQTELARLFGELVLLGGPMASGPGPFAAAADWIEKNKDAPFFLYLHAFAPHAPYPHLDESAEFLPGVSSAAIAAVKAKISASRGGTTDGWSPEELSILSGLYDANLHRADGRMGTLFRRIGELGLRDDTIFVITADHGENLGEHGLLFHEPPPWDSVTHVPLVIVYPKAVPAGKVVSGLTGSLDIAPTLLALVGLQTPPGKIYDGQNLFPARDQEPVVRDEVLTDDSIRTARYKYIVSRDFLADIAADPGETKNLAAAQPATRDDLRRRHERLIAPYRARFEAARSPLPPDSPFYLIVHKFHLGPEGSLAKVSKFDEPSPSKDPPPWVLTVDGVWTELRRSTDSRTSDPITLSQTLPPGRYRVSVLLGARRLLTPQEMGLRFRFLKDEAFRSPGKARPVEKTGRKGSYFYLDLGEADAADGMFRLEIEASPAAGAGFAIHHVRFAPATRSQSDTPTPPNVETLRKAKAQMQESGYW